MQQISHGNPAHLCKQIYAVWNSGVSVDFYAHSGPVVELLLPRHFHFTITELAVDHRRSDLFGKVASYECHFGAPRSSLNA